MAKDLENTITTGIDKLRAALGKADSESHEDREKAQAEAIDTAISLFAVFLQNQNRIANALEKLVEKGTNP